MTYSRWFSLLCYTFPEGDTNKCLLTSDTKASTDQSNDYTKVQISRLMDSPGFLSGAWMMTQRQLLHQKSIPSMDDDSGKSKLLLGISMTNTLPPTDMGKHPLLNMWLLFP